MATLEPAAATPGTPLTAGTWDLSPGNAQGPVCAWLPAACDGVGHVFPCIFLIPGSMMPALCGFLLPQSHHGLSAFMSRQGGKGEDLGKGWKGDTTTLTYSFS